MIPLCDLKQQYESLKNEIDAAMQSVATSGQYILGPQVKAFEQEMAEYCGCKYAVGVGSGTDALHLALRALGIGPGDEVITTPFTFIATTEAIGMVGATPVFVDVDPHTFNLDPNQIEAAITPRTKAFLPVHLYGQPCEMDIISEMAIRYDIDIIEDCAQALGAHYQGQKVGTLGTAGCLSFFPSKNLGSLGDGGMVVTNNDEVYEQVEMLRRHGGKVKYHHERLGLNSRLDELQAAILRVKLPHLNHWNDLRRARAHQYNRLLRETPAITLPLEKSDVDETRSVYHQYTILCQERDRIQRHLKEMGIGSAIYYPVPLHKQQVHAGLALNGRSFPVAEAIASRCLSLPMFPELTYEQQRHVVDSLENAVAICSDVAA